MNKPNAPREGSELPALDDGLVYFPQASNEKDILNLVKIIECRERQLKAALSSPQQESAEDAWRRGWLAGYKDAVCDFNNDRSSDIRPYVAPPATAEGKDRG